MPGRTLLRVVKFLFHPFFMAGSPEVRRKRKRTNRAHAGFRNSSRYGQKVGMKARRFPSLPCLAVLFALAMMAAVCIRKALRASARRTAVQLRISNRVRDMPLAVLLQDQHEIDHQVPLRGVDAVRSVVDRCTKSYSCDPRVGVRVRVLLRLYFVLLYPPYYLRLLVL